MDSREILESIKKELSHEGVDCFLQQDDEGAETRLVVYNGTHQERVQVLQLTARPAAMGGDNTCFSVQLDAVFPFAVRDAAIIDVSQFLHFLNLQLEVPGFYFDHLNHAILYRYVLFIEQGHIPRKIILSLIGNVIFFQDVFGSSLERLAKAEVTFVDLMQEIHDALAKAMK